MSSASEGPKWWPERPREYWDDTYSPPWRVMSERRGAGDTWGGRYVGRAIFVYTSLVESLAGGGAPGAQRVCKQHC
jgi:hypothetical protein